MILASQKKKKRLNRKSSAAANNHDNGKTGAKKGHGERCAFITFLRSREEG